MLEELMDDIEGIIMKLQKGDISLREAAQDIRGIITALDMCGEID